MNLDTFLELLTDHGQRALAEAGELVSRTDPVTAASTLRRSHPADLTSAALVQAGLRARAAAKFGADAARMYFTPAGLEQATRPEVAAHRARRLSASGAPHPSASGPSQTPTSGAPRTPASGAPRSADRSTPDRDMTGTAPDRDMTGTAPDRDMTGSAPGREVTGSGPRVADLCCGIGGDVIELARAGCAVDAADRDPLTAAVAAANADALGLSARARIRTASAEDADPGDYDVVFLDPARRVSGRRVFDPLAYSPTLPEALALAGAAPGACLKVAPGLPYEFVPAGAEAEWVSYRGEVKEAALWLGTLAGGTGAADGWDGTGGEPFTRRATLLPSGETLVADPRLGPAEHGKAGRYLYEPDGAAIRAHLVAEVAAMVRGRLLDPHIAYITADDRVSTPWASCYEIVEMMPFSGKRLRAALRERGVGNVTLKKRGSAVDIERLRKDLKLSGDNSLVVVLTRISDKPIALLCEPMSSLEQSSTQLNGTISR
ncbi:hypothetical protein Misp01_07130 [Microtetraspora sp. NBRC 13810]|uniref:class I SAM-dependent methyltransferase n=1 Tax=Microtetraspora sp. NBRC 13810 TaxID=3030990 RepID=UPI0024A3718E|nr:SAM-dependent methyltransferase [Microtetraspora sp. NBRC 13810]GLW05583.1 hypothetical protein Misp01_07130 [Microtetraspora sp. NBRC 13810]